MFGGIKIVIKPIERDNELYYCNIYTDDNAKYSCVFKKSKEGYLSLEECQKTNYNDIVWSMKRNGNFTDSSRYAIEIVKGRYQRKVTFIENTRVYEDVLNLTSKVIQQYGTNYSYYAVLNGIPTLTSLTANELDIRNYFAIPKVFYTENGYIPDRINLDENLPMFTIQNGICLGVNYPYDTDFLEVLLLDDLGSQVLESFANQTKIDMVNKRTRKNPFSNLFRR